MRESRPIPSVDRLWRLAALFALFGLIYYFSFDNGRQTSKARVERLQEQVQRLEADNTQLRGQLTVQQRELVALRGKSPEGGAALVADASGGPGGSGPATGEDGPGAGAEDSGAGTAASGGASEGAPDRAPGAFTGEAPGAFIGEAGAVAVAAADERDASPEPTLTRLSVRNDESKLVLDGQVLVSVSDIDSLDRTAVVRVHQLDAERREARTMEPGDSVLIDRSGTEHRLLLDQLKGSQAVFILISP
jgi:hypothetical protein